ncbi:RPR domain-containing protein [Cryptosporidium canis]|uniref:RPR domain-containing protein n=1 Tax=Cryptosporidium canis TaxID=195482 RepID=A0A9D5DKF4_9CRYT|nr:RPR domain-containing protein [Cryptosporidium canis]
MDSSSPEKLVRIRYAEVLRNLRGPAGSGKMIQNLTLLAEDQRQYAHIIASVILEEIPRSDIPRKYVLLCLVDSIVRKCRSGSIFFPYFLPYIAPYFAEAYTTKTSPQILRSLEKLLKVWCDSFPRDIVQKLISTTNNVRSKLNEAPIEIEVNGANTVSSKPNTSNVKPVGGLNSSSATDAANSNNTENSNNGMDKALANEMYINISKAIINKCNIKDVGNAMLNKLVLDPTVHKIAYLNTYGKIQESQMLMDTLIMSIDSKNVEHKHMNTSDQIPASKRQKQDVSVVKVTRGPEINSINHHFGHTTSQSSKLIGVPFNIQQHIVPQIPPNQSVMLSNASNTTVPPSVSAAVAAAAAAAAAVVQSKAQIQQQKHASVMMSPQPIINQVITSQQLSSAASQPTSSSLLNNSGVSNSIKKTFSPRFLENSTSSILFAVWNQLFQNRSKKESDSLKRIHSSIIDGKGDQNIFLEGLQVKEVGDLLLFYKRLQENVDASIQFKKTVWLKSHFIKKRIIDNINDFNLQANISMYYADRPNQCHTCGYRFIDNKKRESHIQVHLSKNLIFRQKKQNSNFQSLWPSLQDWIYTSDKNTSESSIEISSENRELLVDSHDRIVNSINEKGSEFIKDASKTSDKGIGFSELFNSLFKHKSVIKFCVENNDSCRNNDGSTETRRVDSDARYTNLTPTTTRANKHTLLTQYVNYLKNISSFNFEDSFNKLKFINDEMSNDVYGDLLDDIDDICNSFSSLWGEMVQSVNSTYTPIDHLHMVCDICHETLKIKWCPINKSWISADAVALTRSSNTRLLKDEHSTNDSHNLMLAVVDTHQEVGNSKLNSIREKVNSNMLNFIQWKFPAQNLVNSNKVIEFRPFGEVCSFIGSGSSFAHNLVGDGFFTAHKSCFIHYFIYSDINNKISNVIKVRPRKYSYSIPNYHFTSRNKVIIKVIQKDNKNIKRFSVI